MSLICTDFRQWVSEHSSTKEDLQYFKNILQDMEETWVDELDEDFDEDIDEDIVESVDK